MNSITTVFQDRTNKKREVTLIKSVSDCSENVFSTAASLRLKKCEAIISVKINVEIEEFQKMYLLLRILRKHFGFKTDELKFFIGGNLNTMRIVLTPDNPKDLASKSDVVKYMKFYFKISYELGISNRFVFTFLPKREAVFKIFCGCIPNSSSKISSYVF